MKQKILKKMNYKIQLTHLPYIQPGRCVILLLKEALLTGFQQKDKNFL